MRIPIVTAEEEIHTQKETIPEKVCFTYAGQPGAKDYLQVILYAFGRLEPELLRNVRLRIVGCTEEQLVSAGIPVQLLRQLKDNLKIYGRISQKEVVRLLRTTDFTMMMRSEQQRYAKAGFPTKVVESLANSTPIICNITSDLALYLEDGKNSLIVPECSVDSVAQVLRRAIQMSFQERQKMQKEACRTARENFLMQGYLEPLKQLLQEKQLCNAGQL